MYVRHRLAPLIMTFYRLQTGGLAVIACLPENDPIYGLVLELGEARPEDDVICKSEYVPG